MTTAALQKVYKKRKLIPVTTESFTKTEIKTKNKISGANTTTATTTTANTTTAKTKKLPRPLELLILAGSYERLLYGLTLSAPSFIYPSHISTITTLTSNQKYLITGSTDEQIKIYSLPLRKEVGILACHQGTITSLLIVDK